MRCKPTTAGEIDRLSTHPTPITRAPVTPGGRENREKLPVLPTAVHACAQHNSTKGNTNGSNQARGATAFTSRRGRCHASASSANASCATQNRCSTGAGSSGCTASRCREWQAPLCFHSRAAAGRCADLRSCLERRRVGATSKPRDRHAPGRRDANRKGPRSLTLEGAPLPWETEGSYAAPGGSSWSSSLGGNSDPVCAPVAPHSQR